jgi:hypothetical protein
MYVSKRLGWCGECMYCVCDGEGGRCGGGPVSWGVWVGLTGRVSLCTKCRKRREGGGGGGGWDLVHACADGQGLAGCEHGRPSASPRTQPPPSKQRPRAFGALDVTLRGKDKRITHPSHLQSYAVGAQRTTTFRKRGQRAGRLAGQASLSASWPAINPGQGHTANGSLAFVCVCVCGCVAPLPPRPCSERCQKKRTGHRMYIFACCRSSRMERPGTVTTWVHGITVRSIKQASLNIVQTYVCTSVCTSKNVSSLCQRDRRTDSAPLLYEMANTDESPSRSQDARARTVISAEKGPGWAERKGRGTGRRD